MIDLYFWPTPNGRKISIMLEECALDYRMILVDINRGSQFEPDFLNISPNNRIPAIVDHGVETAPISVFESGAILIYIAEKTGRFMPLELLGRKTCLEWLFWQVGNLGPSGGQLSHFVNYSPKTDNDYSRNRYANEYNRCLGVLDRRLTGRKFILGDYSIADMACWPWVLSYKNLGQPLDEFSNVRRWHDTIKVRPAVRAGVNLGKDLVGRSGPVSDIGHEVLFNQTAKSVASTAQLKNK